MLRRTPLFVQMIAGFSFILLAVVAAAVYSSYQTSSYLLLENAGRYLNESVRQIAGKLDVLFTEYDHFTQMVAFNPTLQQYLSEVAFGRNTDKSAYEITRFLADQNRYLGMRAMNILHLTDVRGGFYSPSVTASLLWKREADMAGQAWYPLVEQGRGRMFWFSDAIWNGGRLHAVVGARRINDLQTLDKRGLLIVAFPVAQLESAVGPVRLGDAADVQIVDRFGRVVYSTRPDEIGRQADAGLTVELARRPNRTVKWTSGGETMFVFQVQSEYSGWRVLAFIRPNVAFRDLDRIGRSAVATALIGWAAAFGLSVFFAWTLVRPIRDMAKRLRRINRGSLEPLPDRANSLEISILNESFNRMIRDLDETIRDLARKQVSEKQAQLAALKAQFRPHFLYNSLNSIYWSLLDAGHTKQAEMVLALSDLMRYSIQPGSEWVTVAEDVEQLRRFLLIAKLRYGERLQADVEVDPDALRRKMMKLLLQPLVENAITHGLEPKKGPWRLRVRIRLVDASLYFVVEDNGGGMPEAARRRVLTEGPGADDRPFHTGIGLANLRERIRLLYGVTDALRLDESEWGGLKVEVTLPADIRG